MFNEKTAEKRIGKELKKSVHLKHLEEVEEYFIAHVSDFDLEASYDVMANELPYFKTLGYTEYAGCLVIHPLNAELRVQQIEDASHDKCELVDFTGFFKTRFEKGEANKYADRKTINGVEPKKHIVVLAGSNKLKSRICLNKLKYIVAKFKGNVLFKPHPLTRYQLIGELQDLFGAEAILPRDADLYTFMQHANVVHTSHLSESAVFAISLGKQVDPIDVYQRPGPVDISQRIEMSSFFHLNRHLFTELNPVDWVNKTFSSPKSGVINPLVDEDWKKKLNTYLEYITEIRECYKGHYVVKKKTEKKEE